MIFVLICEKRLRDVYQFQLARLTHATCAGARIFSLGRAKDGDFQDSVFAARGGLSGKASLIILRFAQGLSESEAGHATSPTLLRTCTNLIIPRLSRFPLALQPSGTLRRKPCRRRQTRCDHHRKNDRNHKQVSPAHNRDRREAKSESPHRDAHGRQRRRRKATKLPRQHRSEQIKRADRKSSRHKEVPVRPAEPLHLKVN